jgi:hypothetical protein
MSTTETATTMAEVDAHPRSPTRRRHRPLLPLPQCSQTAVGSGADGAFDGGPATETVTAAVRWRRSDGGNGGDAVTTTTTMTTTTTVSGGGWQAGGRWRQRRGGGSGGEV